MAERKVINKYIPPDFDPKKLTRVQGARNTHKTVRLMTPFSMRWYLFIHIVTTVVSTSTEERNLMLAKKSSMMKITSDCQYFDSIFDVHNVYLQSLSKQIRKIQTMFFVFNLDC